MAKSTSSLESMIRARVEDDSEKNQSTIDSKPSIESSALEKPVSTQSGKPKIEKITVYLPKAAYKFIKQVALDHDRKPHDVLLDGIDTVLRQHGKSLKDFQR